MNDNPGSTTSAAGSRTAPSGEGPLNGIRVIEIGSMVAGPVACTLLGDFGAEVIKVEPPGKGDPIRAIGPFVGDESLWFQVEGRNKRSMTIDLRRPAGQALFRKLVETADIVIENFRPGTLAKWQIDYAALSKINPALIMVSLSCFGQTGPYASRASYDRIALAFSGLLGATGYPDRPPVRPATAIADYQTALFGAFGAMLALYHRDAHGGEGQYVDLALFEAVFRFTDVMITAFDKLGMPRERRGNRHFAAAPGDHFETREGGFLVLTCSGDSVFERLATAMDRPDLPLNPDFCTHDQRWRNIDAINAIVGEWIKSKPTAQIRAALDTHQLAYSPVYGPQDILQDAHYAAREAIAEIDVPGIGAIKMPGVFPKLSASPAPPLKPAPLLGADTQAILDELAVPADQAAQFRADRII